MQNLSPNTLVPMDIFVQDAPVQIALAYQHDAPPNIFGKIYHDQARLWLHESLAKIVLQAAYSIKDSTGLHCILYDGLRTIESQERMLNASITGQNPQWLEEPTRLLSPPGNGGHPRGMAIDISLIHPNGTAVNMGTDFDFLAQNPAPAHNRAHRDHDRISDEAKHNRNILTKAMLSASEALGIPLLPLPQEWWDFRLPAEYYNRYAPLSDHDLPPQMRMSTTKTHKENAPKNFSSAHFKALKDKLLCDIKIKSHTPDDWDLDH